MKKTDKYNVKEWEELASLLSDEKGNNKDLLKKFVDEDIHNTGKFWKELPGISGDKIPDVDKAWENVRGRLDLETRKELSFSDRQGQMGRTLLRIAAAVAVLIALGITAIYINNNDAFSKKTTLATDSDEKNLQVLLPDGSTVFLNRNSSLSYHTSFGKKERLVKLSGEAFFEISSNKAKPFIVDAGNASVKVVGTSFNVITNNDRSAVEVFVKSGKVMLSDNTGAHSLMLDPGFVGTIDSEITEKTINKDPNYMSWNTGLLVYNGQKLDVVFRDLKKVYNMDIVADDPGILENTWTSPIDNQQQETIIRLICTSFNLSYSKVGDIYHLAKK
jgi:ferric-dicitrate binding protein FerR (iron transport regulator)